MIRPLLFLALIALAATATLRYTSKDLTVMGRQGSDGELSWSMSGYSFAVDKATTATDSVIALKMAFHTQSDTSFYLSVRVDKKEMMSFHVNSTTSNVLDFELATSKAMVEVVKISEANYSTSSIGVMKLESLTIANGALRRQHDSRAKKLLFIGDSLTCGYGNLGTDPCTFDGSTEDALQSYPSVLADLLAVPLGVTPLIHTICYSGKGVVRNYADTAPGLTMPVYYNRSLATQQDSYWDPRRFPADAVYVMLGSNDYSTQPVPDAATFIDTYLRLLRRVGADYPGAALLAACAPEHWSYHPDQCANIKAAEAAFKQEAGGAAAQYVQPTAAHATSYGCDGHPSAQTHRQIAESLLPTFLSVLK